TRRAVAGDRRGVRLLQQRPAGVRGSGRRPLRGARRARRPRTDTDTESLRRARDRSLASPGCSRTAAARTIARSSGSRCPRSARVHPFAQTYLRLSILGAPALLITLAGAGYLRGLQDTRTTLVIAVVSNAANLVIEIFFVYGLDLGIAGSAWGTVLAQYGAALAYIAITARSVRREHASVRPQAAGIRASASVGGRLVLRGGLVLAAV